jgi:hypothetical protein
MLSVAIITRMKSFATSLKGGDRRSIGRANAVLAELRRDPARFDELWICLSHADPLVRMRAADVLEKLSRDDASMLAGHKHELISQSLDDGSPELRWHLVAITSRLTLSLREARKLCVWYDHCLREDPSRIVKVFSLQAASELASRHRGLTADFERMLRLALASPWPSVRARANRLRKRAAI